MTTILFNTYHYLNFRGLLKELPFSLPRSLSQFWSPFRQQIPTLSQRSVSRWRSNFNDTVGGKGGKGEAEGAQKDRWAEEAEEGQREETEVEANRREVGARIAASYGARRAQWNNNVEVGSQLLHESSQKRIC